MRLVLIGALAAAGFLATPASATCMEHYDDPKTGIRIGSCAPPGGPVTTYYCVRDICVHN
ncbi:MAG TPA: hypothetical protein VNQ77_13425 [Frankiaceae bacterium]|nr:hypothetical protein [Frankiaceae bacterium]